jgi:hypothetical protein
MPNTDKTVVNLNGNYEFTDDLSGFFEAKYVKAEGYVFVNCCNAVYNYSH